MRKFFLFFYLLFNIMLYAQDYQQFSQHTNLQGLINPAYNGSRESYSALILNRNQWGGAVNTFAFNAHAPLPVEGLGAGLVIVQDELGLYSNFLSAAAVSYRLNITNDIVLSAGIQLGYAREQTADPSVVDPTDGVVVNDDEINNRLSTGFGFFMTSPKFFLGLSMPELLPYGTSSDESIIKEIPLMLYGGYLFDIVQDIKLKPTAFFQAAVAMPLHMEFGIDAYYKDVIGLGIASRVYPFSSLVFTTEVKVVNNLFLGYSYDMYLGTDGGMQAGAHEISMRFDISSRDLFTKPHSSMRYF